MEPTEPKTQDQIRREAIASLSRASTVEDIQAAYAAGANPLAISEATDRSEENVLQLVFKDGERGLVVEQRLAQEAVAATPENEPVELPTPEITNGKK